MCIIYEVILARIIYIGQYISWRLYIFLIFLTKSFTRRWFYVSKYFFHMPVFNQIGGNFSDKTSAFHQVEGNFSNKIMHLFSQLFWQAMAYISCLQASLMQSGVVEVWQQQEVSSCHLSKVNSICKWHSHWNLWKCIDGFIVKRYKGLKKYLIMLPDSKAEVVD